MVDNFLKTQNVLDKVKLQGVGEMKSLPSSPIADARNNLKMRQMQMMSTPRHQQPQPLSNKNRRLTSSASSTHIPAPMSRIPGAMSTAQVCYNTVNTQQTPSASTMPRQITTGRNSALETPASQAQTTEAITDRAANVTSGSSELAKIQPTSALSIDHQLLVKAGEGQPRTELVTKFVDFSSKYGLGYMLSNGSYGVLFNDSTKIILHPNLFHFDYIERSKQQPNFNSNG